MLRAALFLLFLLAACAAPTLQAGETPADRRIDRMGITVRAAERNAAHIRRAQSKRSSRIEKTGDGGEWGGYCPY